MRGVNNIGYIVLWLELLSIFIYLILTCKDLENSFSIIIISNFFKLRNNNYERFLTLDIIDIPIYVKLNANRLPTCINYNYESYYYLPYFLQNVIFLRRPII